MKNKNEKPEKQIKPVQNIKPEDKNTKIPETGGRGGLDPSRFGDWEIAGKCVDF